MRTDAELIRAARYDADAFGELYRRHAEDVHVACPRRAPERAAPDAAVGGVPCRGVDWAVERARAVSAGIEPESMLMPGAR